jgi:acyl carrier protein
MALQGRSVLKTVGEEEFLTLIERLYQLMKSVTRTIRAEDRIVQDLGIDSLGALDLIAELEEHLGILLLDDPRLAGVETVEDLFGLVRLARCDDLSEVGGGAIR